MTKIPHRNNLGKIYLDPGFQRVQYVGAESCALERSIRAEEDGCSCHSKGQADRGIQEVARDNMPQEPTSSDYLQLDPISQSRQNLQIQTITLSGWASPTSVDLFHISLW